MLLESIMTNDFIPLVKKPIFWMAPKTLKNGDQIEIDDAVGHQVLAAYPGAFKVIAYGGTQPIAEQPSTRKPRKQAEQKVVTSEQMESKNVSDTVAEVTM